MKGAFRYSLIQVSGLLGLPAFFPPCAFIVVNFISPHSLSSVLYMFTSPFVFLVRIVVDFISHYSLHSFPFVLYMYSSRPLVPLDFRRGSDMFEL
jgi:hypothetical protein